MKLSYLKKVRSSQKHGLTKFQYSNYMRSKHWRKFRKKMWKQKPHRCWICNMETQKLDLHHKTYKNLGNEKANQVIFLCRPCHSKLHRTLWKNTNKKVNLWNIAGKMKRFRNKNRRNNA